MTECPNCKAPVREETRFCSACGQRLQTQSSTSDAPTVPASGGFSTVAHTLLPGMRLQGGRYLVKKVLGEGGMGAAAQATDNRLDDKPVVIKELISDSTDDARFQDDVRNFKREVAMLAHIDHPLIPNVTDHFQEGSRYFMVQEYVEGETLEERITRLNQPLKERDVLIYALEVLDVLDYLSQQTPPIVHRDIKPANIIIGSKDKKAYLVDFGIARAEVMRNAQRKQTTALGTPGYAPPEQYQGNADPRSDLYALGATLHHLLTNRDPRHHAPFSYPPVRTLNPQLSPDIERVLTRALLNDMTQRYQSATALRQDFVSILQQRFGVSDSLGHYGATSSSSLPAYSAPTTVGTPPVGQSGGLVPVGQSASGAIPPTVRMVPQGGTSVTPPVLPPVYGPPPYTPQSLAAPGWAGPQSQPRRRQPWWLFLLLLLLVCLLIGGGVFFYQGLLQGKHTTTEPNKAGMGVTQIGNELIGVSDGSYSFDTGRANGSLMTQAAERYRQGDIGGATSLWSQAAAQVTSDAEPLIYLENQHVATVPHITLVVATMLSGDGSSVGAGRDNLQGAYLAQKEFNDGAKLSGGLKVRLLLANSGSKSTYVNQVVERIKNIVASDKTVVGVMGWPFSSRAVGGAQLLGEAHIPLLSPTATSDQLTGISPYFFRVAPTNKAEAIAGARYVANTLHAKSVAVFVDVAESYSQSLAQDFERQWQSDGNKLATEARYTTGDGASIIKALPGVLATHPDVIYFAGHSADVNVLLLNLPLGNIQVMGGDALYELNGYTSSARAGFSRLRFTALAYPDEWSVLGKEDQTPGFFAAYSATYNPSRNPPPSVYGYTRPTSDVMLSYDAMTALLKGAENILKTGKTQITPVDLKNGLAQISGSHAFQGVSGQISFGPNGDPVDKAVVILHVSNDGYIQMESGIEGRFSLK
ncbi:protein kinase domain-containing protein [Ktedonobacter racemifer]|uniref:non-specific serine/threonine protein kinase n=1 Tax=Ktedonobacter racemifer DSM 44963 TaxID=485913 RepID=D6TF33_KTERA|nr:ABC transporter substrate-binding protein [Ktedonobacter racemifer]EFH90433.1 serine/threonine protein kinase [Ktedonobacter racemifer DSM 44963]